MLFPNPHFLFLSVWLPACCASMFVIGSEKTSNNFLSVSMFGLSWPRSKRIVEWNTFVIVAAVGQIPSRGVSCFTSCVFSSLLIQQNLILSSRPSSLQFIKKQSGIGVRKKFGDCISLTWRIGSFGGRNSPYPL
jgi:hypothetical protein